MVDVVAVFDVVIVDDVGVVFVVVDANGVVVVLVVVVGFLNYLHNPVSRKI